MKVQYGNSRNPANDIQQHRRPMDRSCSLSQSYIELIIVKVKWKWLFYSVLLWNNHLPIRYHHRQSGSTAYRLQARPAPTGPALCLTAMPRPNLPFNGLHLRNPCKLHGSLLIYRPRRDGRLSWPSWLTHSRHLTHEVVTRKPWIRRRSGKVRQLQTDVLSTEPCRQL